MIHAVAVCNGTPYLKDISKNIEMEVTKTKAFSGGPVLLCYKAQFKQQASKKEQREIAMEEQAHSGIQ